MIDLVFFNLLGIICVLFTLLAARHILKNKNKISFWGHIVLMLAGFIYFLLCAGMLFAIDSACNHAISDYMFLLDSMTARMYAIAIAISLLVICIAEIFKICFGIPKGFALVIVFAIIANSIITLQPIAYYWIQFLYRYFS